MKYRKTILLIVAMALSASVYASDTAFPILMSRQEAAFPKIQSSLSLPP